MRTLSATRRELYVSLVNGEPVRRVFPVRDDASTPSTRRASSLAVALNVDKRLTTPQNLQAMDNSHVALVSVHLDASGFKRYRCDRPMPLGVNIGSLTKVLKCAKVGIYCCGRRDAHVRDRTTMCAS
jgi:hypothetical protein